jgi:pimeloyl-ACP methyl ester carboxylesterase
VLIPGQLLIWESYSRVLPTLAKKYHVFALDVRGHGSSGRTPGQYTLATCGRDIVAFLRGVVKQPAVVAGNSSGGLIAIWAAGEAPELVRAIVPEDPPLFSAEWPRLKTCYVYRFMHEVVGIYDAAGTPDLAAFLANLEIPSEKGQGINKIPVWLAHLLAAPIARAQRKRPGRPVEPAWMPFQIRLLVKSLSMFDPGFTAAFFDGAACDFDHAEALRRVRCPMLLLKAHAFTHPTLGLVGAMTADDIARIRTLAPHAVIREIDAGHSIHLEEPGVYVRELTAFLDGLG